MIDVEEEVYAKVRDAVLAAHPDTFITSQLLAYGTRLPAMLFFMSDTRTDTERVDSSGAEYSAFVEFEAQVYSADSSAECREIISTCDDAMKAMGFRRRFYSRVVNEDPTIRRYIARWEATAFSDGRVGR